MLFNQILIGKRTYRCSVERKENGRPVVMQFCNRRGIWRDVRNQSRIDQLWKLMDAQSEPTGEGVYDAETAAEHNRRKYPDLMARVDALVEQVLL